MTITETMRARMMTARKNKDKKNCDFYSYVVGELEAARKAKQTAANPNPVLTEQEEIDVPAFTELADAGIHYAEPSKFPAIDVDLSFVSETFAPIGKAIENANCSLIKNVEVVDTYRDENGKSITVRMTFSNPERTLTTEEVMEVANGIIDALAKDGIALKS